MAVQPSQLYHQHRSLDGIRDGWNYLHKPLLKVADEALKASGDVGLCDVDVLALSYAG